MPNLNHSRKENFIGIAWMIASMAGFSIEDAFLKTVTKHVSVGQVLMMFGAAGLCVFAPMLLGCAIVIGAGLFIGWQNQRQNAS